MNLENPDTGLKLKVTKELLDRLYSIGMKHYPKEFGGLLVGRYEPDLRTCVICDTILPKKYSSSKYYFERGVEGLTEELLDFYERNPRLIYIGEWHTHPDMVAEPSETDKKAMIEIANHEEVYISNPILLIMSNNKSGYSFNCFVQLKNAISKYLTIDIKK